ncbi:hypothetical protein MCHIJ_48790 [Mycolicibacterium chitae]|uniref:PRC-barrel domain-containing protein n=1 Tax=Mycolicibacterium chitae TaxID=1792 RepID=A0A3S4RFC1_MYCCI|nr:hypothetical protein [Mycolicibacterium chitae]MCV7104491.1 hypothetical protein [Mycolicibacterium chitae]BBZ05442.1 hypothetical protein MCHIJ_48790 [Mycolicibacterium chitae]VEG49058.1 Uncharacterised protein [Mycolicibacterium chitae]
MQLSSLLGMPVVDAGHHRLGTVTDVRLSVPGDRDDRPGTPRVAALVMSPRTRSSYLGYERTSINAPLVIAALAKWLHRGTFTAAWEDVARVGSERITLRPGYSRGPAALKDGQ